MYDEVQETRYFWIDDVYVIAKKVQLSQVDITNLTMSETELKTITPPNNFSMDIRPIIFGPPELGGDQLRLL